MSHNIEERLVERLSEMEQLAKRLEKHEHQLTELVERQAKKIKELQAQLPPEDATFYERKQHPSHASVAVLIPDPQIGFTRVTSFHSCIADAVKSVDAFPRYTNAEIYIRYNPPK